MNRVIVTGGGGFVGKAIVFALKLQGVACEVIGRSRYPDLEQQGIICHQGDISDREFVQKTLNGFDVVFHTAALAGIWGGWKNYYNVNVVGTENIIESCQTNNIPVLVYTSTPSVVFNGEDIEKGDESLSYPEKFLCNYAKTKAMAERAVLEVDQRSLKTCAIRPHLIWGPGDPHLIPRLIERGRAGELKIVGKGKNKVDITYIDNVSHAHILAAKELINRAKCSGKAYFIGQERAVEIWPWINELFQRVGVNTITQKVPFRVAYTAGTIMELIHRILYVEKEPKMTRFIAEQLAKSHYFSHSRAFKDFNYEPVITIEEGMDRLIHWIKNDI